MRKPLILAVLIACSGCNKTETIKGQDKTVEVPRNAFGTDLKYTPISDTSDSLQRAGRAVGIVRLAEDNTGTGFFISSDGLFLTNFHVVTGFRCIESGCPGVQIIRNFTPSGDFQVLNHVKKVIADSDLDFTILKVELQDGQQVPYLNLQPIGDKELDGLSSKSLLVLGHPFGASLRVTPAKFQYWSGSQSYLQSSAISGNSGSPLIDESTSGVVGLYHAGDWDKNTTSTKGEVEHFGEAINISQIIRFLKTAVPEYGKTGVLSVDTFSHEIKEVKYDPMEDSHYFDLLVAKGANPDNLHLEVERMRTASVPVEHAENLLGNLFPYELNKGDHTVFASADTDRLKAFYEPGSLPGPNMLTRFLVLDGLIGRNACMGAFSDEQRYRLLWMLNLSFYCWTSNGPGNENILSQSISNVEKSSENNRYHRVLITIRTQALMGQINSSNKPEVASTLQHITEQSQILRNVLGAEGFRALLQKNPDLVGPAAFKDTY